MAATQIEPRIGDQVFLEEGGEEVGAVRSVEPRELTVYIENARDFTISKDAVRAVHDGKVILDEQRLDATIRSAVLKAHTQEQY